VKTLLDSTVLIGLLRSRSERRGWLDALAASGHELATSVINVAEIYAGMHERERAATEALFARLLILDVTHEIAVRAGELRRARRKKGFVLALMDTLVAATALHHGFALMTDSVKHFPMEDLTLFPVPMIQ
jgi:predicted nucleic acid-binding protein